jgi:amino acid transporter
MSFFSFIFGRRLASTEQKKDKMGVASGLPALGLDGLSSSAYGPEAALTILIPLGAAGLNFIGPITLVILILLGMLYLSYRQTIAAYPVNGGSYTVAKENLGTWACLLAAAALMIDYVLTVAVGISAGIAALVSAEPRLHPYTMPLCLGILGLITLLNLRGTGEAGAAFAVPTYLFIFCLMIVLGVGLFKSITGAGHPHPVEKPPIIPHAMEGVGIWILLRSFASGCAAMTGVEAVSNGVSAFKDPAVKNAHRTLTCIVVLLSLLLGGIAILSHSYQIGAMDQEKPGYQSVLSQLTGAVVGRGWLYKTTIASILCVLCLSANTSFVGFPRLCKLIAKDDFLPRGFAALDRRLVYSAGVISLAVLAGILLAVFRGITDRLIPLYAVGAFMAFTLSQTGMVMHWRNEKDAKHKKLKISINAIGAIATGAALTIILIAKFIEGAWITVLAIPMMILLFQLIHRHYVQLDAQINGIQPLDTAHYEPPVVLIPIHYWGKPIAKSIRFGMHLSKDVIAIHLTNLEGDQANDEQSSMKREWDEKVDAPARQAGLVPPQIQFVRTPYREFITPLLAQIDKIKQKSPDRAVAVIITELVEKHWWQAALHSRRASRLRSALRAREDYRVIVIDLPWFVQPAPVPAEEVVRRNM